MSDLNEEPLFGTFFQTNEGRHFVSFNEVVYVSARGKRTIFHTTSQTI